jgi:hypothetical protein
MKISLPVDLISLRPEVGQLAASLGKSRQDCVQVRATTFKGF